MKNGGRSKHRGRRRVALSIVLAILGLANGGASGADDPNAAQHPAAGSLPRLIQGRITDIQGTVVMVKTPDGYPGATGNHAMFVVSGPTLKVDVSGARIVLPDGRQADTRPLSVGDRVVAGLYESDSGANQPYHAFIIERVIPGDTVVTH